MAGLWNNLADRQEAGGKTPEVIRVLKKYWNLK